MSQTITITAVKPCMLGYVENRNGEYPFDIYYEFSDGSGERWEHVEARNPWHAVNRMLKSKREAMGLGPWDLRVDFKDGVYDNWTKDASVSGKHVYTEPGKKDVLIITAQPYPDGPTEYRVPWKRIDTEGREDASIDGQYVVANSPEEAVERFTRMHSERYEVRDERPKQPEKPLQHPRLTGNVTLNFGVIMVVIEEFEDIYEGKGVRFIEINNGWNQGRAFPKVWPNMRNLYHYSGGDYEGWLATMESHGYLVLDARGYQHQTQPKPDVQTPSIELYVDGELAYEN